MRSLSFWLQRSLGSPLCPAWTWEGGQWGNCSQCPCPLSPSQGNAASDRTLKAVLLQLCKQRWLVELLKFCEMDITGTHIVCLWLGLLGYQGLLGHSMVHSPSRAMPSASPCLHSSPQQSRAWPSQESQVLAPMVAFTNCQCIATQSLNPGYNHTCIMHCTNSQDAQ